MNANHHQPPQNQATNRPPVIELRNATRTYPTGGVPLRALRGVSLCVEANEWVTLVGPSGSGKSTLLNLITGLDRADEGLVRIAGTDLRNLNEERLARWLAGSVGIVFQFFQLLPTLTALENVLLAMEFGRWRGDRRGRAEWLLSRVGLGDRLNQLPGELSGGEQQRVAVARALANDPPLLVADEPTGNLDATSGAIILGLLTGYWRDGGTLLLVTHDPAIAETAPRLVKLADGQVVSDSAQRRTADALT